jgi:hypothetical protein
MIAYMPDGSDLVGKLINLNAKYYSKPFLLMLESQLVVKQ